MAEIKHYYSKSPGLMLFRGILPPVEFSRETGPELNKQEWTFSGYGRFSTSDEDTQKFLDEKMQEPDSLLITVDEFNLKMSVASNGVDRTIQDLVASNRLMEDLLKKAEAKLAEAGMRADNAALLQPPTPPAPPAEPKKK